MGERKVASKVTGQPERSREGKLGKVLGRGPKRPVTCEDTSTVNGKHRGAARLKRVKPVLHNRKTSVAGGGNSICGDVPVGGMGEAATNGGGYKKGESVAGRGMGHGSLEMHWPQNRFTCFKKRKVDFRKVEKGGKSKAACKNLGCYGVRKN